MFCGLFGSHPQLNLCAWFALALAAHRRTRAAKLRRIRLVKPATLGVLPSSTSRRPPSSAFSDGDGELERYLAHGHLAIAEPVFGQAGFAAARAASSIAVHPSWVAPAVGNGVEAMDVDDDPVGLPATTHPRRPPGLDEPDDLHDDEPLLEPLRSTAPAAAATSDGGGPSDPWRGFQRAPRAFGHPGGVREVEPGGTLERLVEEWTIDDRPHGAVRIGGRRREDAGGGWLGRLTTGWRGTSA